MKIKKIKVNEIVGTAVTVLIAVLIFFPLIWLLVSSFKSDADVIKWPPIFFPTQWLTAQYKYVVDAIPILSMLKNTVVFSVGVTVVSLFFDSMAAYAFSRKESYFWNYSSHNDGSFPDYYDSSLH